MSRTLHLQRRSQRFFDVSERSDARKPFERDRDRVLYSDEFRRLGGVTQVISPAERQLIHTRLTHSLEVAQIARALARKLVESVPRPAIEQAGGLDPYVVETAALVHDLGHPPFGHVTESQLNHLLRKNGVSDGFEGNAQSFRIVTKLSVRRDDHVGLNLTRASLAAVLKYPWLVSSAKEHDGKWGCYDSELEIFKFAREFAPSSDTKSLEAALMDWADDIAYAVHDVYDFVRAGLIPLERLIVDPAERESVVDCELQRPGGPRSNKSDLLAGFERVLDFAPRGNPLSRRHFAELHQFSSALVDRYISAIRFTGNGWGESAIEVPVEHKNEVAVLKGLTWQYVISGQALTTQRFGQRRLVTSLFDLLAEAASNAKEWTVFSPVVQGQLAQCDTEQQRLRVVADVIASMTERQAVDLHLRLTGLNLGSALDQALL